jgi:hypothetical protein
MMVVVCEEEEETGEEGMEEEKDMLADGSLVPARLFTSATLSSVTLMVCAIISPAVRLMSLASLASVGADRRNHSFAELPPPAAPFSTELAPRCCKMASARFVFSTILRIQFSICRIIVIVTGHIQ